MPSGGPFYVPTGQNFFIDLDFVACSVTIDNNTNQYLREPQSNRFIGPYRTQVVLGLNPPTAAGRIFFEAPPGVTQPAVVAGQSVFVFFSPVRPFLVEAPAGIGGIDTAGADIQPLVGGDDTGIAGTTGLSADAGHQHPAKTGGAVSGVSLGFTNIRFGLKDGTPRVLWDDATHLWVMDLSTNTIRLLLTGVVTAFTVDSTGHLQAANYCGPTASVAAHSHPHTHGINHQHTGITVGSGTSNFITGSIFSDVASASDSTTGGAHSHPA